LINWTISCIADDNQQFLIQYVGEMINVKGSYQSKSFFRMTIVIFSLMTIGLIMIAHSCSKDQEPITIGAIIPLTGPASQHTVIVDAMHLAAGEVNRAGGINGRKLKLVVADSKSNPKAGKDAFRKMEEEHQPLLYVSSTSVVSLAIAPLAEETQVVLAGLVVSNSTLTDQKKWVFRYYVSPKNGSYWYPCWRYCT
jgi:ABC-type branched-subunit amino acid transport system substrate-binding protein